MTSSSATAARSLAARRRGRWAASASSSRPRPRCGSRRRASRSSPSSGRRSSSRSATCSSRRPSRGWPTLEARRELQASLGVPVERVDASFVAGLETSGCPRSGVLRRGRRRRPACGDRRSSFGAPRELGVEVREHTLAESLLDSADTLVIACGPWSAELGAPGRRRAADPAARAGSCSRPSRSPRRRRRCRWSSRPRPASISAAAATGSCSRCPTPEPRWGFETTVDESVFADRLARLAHRYPPAAGCRIDRGVGRALRHDARRSPDPRSRRRRRLRGLRLLGPRLHAVACGRAGDRRGDPRRRGSARPRRPTGSSASREDLGFPETVVL